MAQKLDGRVAVVTGAGAGLGAAIARRLGQEGARVVVSDINADAAKSVAYSIDGAIACTTDVTDEAQVQQLITDTQEHLSLIHI